MDSPVTAQSRAFDALLDQLARYTCQPLNASSEAIETARYCLLDSIGCGLLALQYPACTKLLGPVVHGAQLQHGARVPGCTYQLDPVQAAFNIGCMIRWLDYNDTWLAAEWGHPSDNFGAILGLADYLDRNPNNPWKPDRQWTIEDVLQSAIKAYEIQGILALENAFNRVGMDHVILVRIASTAVACSMLGGNTSQIASALSQAWIDGGALRTYRHAPNTGSRKSWAAGDATRRAVQLALWTMQGEMGYPSALSATRWGFQDVFLSGKPIHINRELGCYVMENILFKVAFPAEFHAQTAAEAAIALAPQIANRLDDIAQITIFTQESAVRIIDKKGPLNNPADRDHCLQYIVAVALLHGSLDSEHYEDKAASDPRIDQLREKMIVAEDPRFTREYLDPQLRSIGNRIQIIFKDGTSTSPVEVEFPIGHRRRRDQAKPLLIKKFKENALCRFSAEKTEKILALWTDATAFSKTRVSTWMDLLAADQ